MATLTSKQPKDIFQAFSSLETLQNIAESRGIDATEKNKKALVSELTSTVTTAGLNLMLKKTLKLKTLRLLAEGIDWGKDQKAPAQKGTIAKKIYDEMESKPKKYLEKFPSATLKAVLEDMDVEVPDNKKDYVTAILDEADQFGLVNLFSSFTVEKLKEFADALKIRVESSSKDVLIDHILALEDYNAPKTSKPKDEQPSEKKPPIDKDISKVDLNYHYYRDDLIEYCKEKKNTSYRYKERTNRSHFSARVWECAT